MLLFCNEKSTRSILELTDEKNMSMYLANSSMTLLTLSTVVILPCNDKTNSRMVWNRIKMH